jgi:hypothetical protein
MMLHHRRGRFLQYPVLPKLGLEYQVDLTVRDRGQVYHFTKTPTRAQEHPDWDEIIRKLSRSSTTRPSLAPTSRLSLSDSAFAGINRPRAAILVDGPSSPEAGHRPDRSCPITPSC